MSALVLLYDLLRAAATTVAILGVPGFIFWFFFIWGSADTTPQ